MSVSDSDSDWPSVVGWLHPPYESATIRARLVRQDASVRVDGLEDAAPLADAALDAIAVSSRIGSIRRRLTFPSGATFVTEDNDGVDRMFSTSAREARSIVHRLERFHPRLVLFAVVVIALLVGVYRYAVPAFTNVAVAATPASISTLIGRNALVVLDRTVLSPSELDADTQDTFVEGFRDLASRAAVGGLHLRLEFRRGGIVGPNALALPDGTVVVTDELVDLSDSDDEVYGVLAHEVTHVERRHTLQRIYRAAGVSAVIMFLGGDVGDLTQDILFQGSALLSLSYSRTQEAEADARSVDLMRAAGRDPAALADLLENIDEACNGCADGGWWASHPGLAERVEAIHRRSEGVDDNSDR